MSEILYKRTVKFHDSENLLVVSELEISTRNNYPEFTMCNEKNGSSGQTEFSPKEGFQTALHDIWNEWHLNNKEKKLSNNFRDILNELCDNIEKEESLRHVDKSEIQWENIEDEKIIALGQHLELTPLEANEDISQDSHDDCLYSYSGQDYLVCTDAEADDKWDNDLENYIDECILPEIPAAYRNYFDNEAWKTDARQDGRGHSLSSYNEEEYEQKVNDTLYFIYRQ